jgi:hypothetical protein
MVIRAIGAPQDRSPAGSRARAGSGGHGGLFVSVGEGPDRGTGALTRSLGQLDRPLRGR